MTILPLAVDHETRVLIVDDEPHNRQLLAVMLAPEAFVLDQAASGEEALIKVAAQPPDLILLDVMMPGMDGYQVATQLKSAEATRNIPIIMVTALDDRNARMLGLTAGAEDFLSKPVDRAELSVRVRNLLRLKAYGDYHDQYGRMLEGEAGFRAAELVQSERLYRETFDSAPLGIAHVDLKGKILRVNQRLCDLLAFTRAALESQIVGDYMTPDQIAVQAPSFKQMVKGTLDRHVIDEIRFRRGDGTSMWARVNVSVHRKDTGDPLHFIAAIEDVTHRRMLEAQIQQATKMDAIGKLAAGVAHDFNNLLTVIIGFAEMVIEDTTLPAQHASDLNEIAKAARRATGLTQQLLAFSRQQVLNAVALDVNALITDMARMLERLIGDRNHVSLTLAPNLALALADRGQLEQVVMNLVVNARDAMPGGGTVTIETQNVDLENSPFHEETVMSGSYVMLAVTDTGTGMSKEVQRRLWEPFFTTKETGKGTGLGLSTTYGIVKQSKGYIWVYSELGIGTTFKVYMPCSAPKEGMAEASPQLIAPVKRGSETVLLVEDEPGVRLLSKRILDNAGYIVLVANDGLDAERLFARHGSKVDLVITDVVMPVCGGPELMKRLHVHEPGLRVLYMSGYTEQSAAARAGLGRDVPLVNKPFTSSEFLRTVRAVLDGQPQRREPAPSTMEGKSLE